MLLVALFSSSLTIYAPDTAVVTTIGVHRPILLGAI